MKNSPIILYIHQRPMVPNNGTQYEENPYSHHGGMRKDEHLDRRLDGLTDKLDRFLYLCGIITIKTPTIKAVLTQWGTRKHLISSNPAHHGLPPQYQ